MQDVAWREQQRRLLTAQFGPREVESLAMNAVLPLESEEGFTGTPLRWVQERELKVRAIDSLTHVQCFLALTSDFTESQAAFLLIPTA